MVPDHIVAWRNPKETGNERKLLQINIALVLKYKKTATTKNNINHSKRFYRPYFNVKIG